jgi:stage V sporulation protein D (sporulation-specific penicillin-binding protein)
LEEGVVTPDDRFLTQAFMKSAGTGSKCWRSYNPHGRQSFREVMQNSCNPGLVGSGVEAGKQEKRSFL